MSIRGGLQGIELGLYDLCGIKGKHTHLTSQGMDKIITYLKAEIEKRKNIEQLKEMLDTAPPDYGEVECPRDLYYLAKGEYKMLSDILKLLEEK